MRRLKLRSCDVSMINAAQRKEVPRIVVIGGGTGVFTVLSGLKKYPVRLSAVVTMADDGGSSGVLREEFGILPPGDVRRALVAMAPADNKLLSNLFNYRFQEGGLTGHSFGNIMLTALERLTGSFEQAIKESAYLLGARGEVFPVTLDTVRLCAELEDGTLVKGETNIDIPKYDSRLKITRVFFDTPARINPRARAAILAANLIVIGPGDLYTSILPNLLVNGVSEALRRARAKKVYVVNIMTKQGETSGFTAADFIAVIEEHCGHHTLDHVLINKKRPTLQRVMQYEKEGAEYVEQGILSKGPVPIFGDFLRPRGFVRHDPDRLAKVLLSLL